MLSTPAWQQWFMMSLLVYNHWFTTSNSTQQHSSFEIENFGVSGYLLSILRQTQFVVRRLQVAP
jgi:hypothetical protein